MKLKLERTLAFIDIEGTGLNRETDRIVELSVTKLFPDGSRENRTRRFNPQIPIPSDATEIHGIKDEDVKDLEPFSYYAKGLMNFIKDCDIAGFASNGYDCPLLFSEFMRAGIYWDYSEFHMIDAGNIFKRKEERTLVAAYKFFCKKDLEGAHGAEADVNATVDVLLAQLEWYQDLPVDVAGLALYSNYDRKVADMFGKFVYNDQNELLLNFGPHRGKRAIDELGFVEWMSGKDFPPDTMNFVNDLLAQQEF
ncbi:MAG: 3'-5' exonuclease [Pedobacter sp.]|nr:3'-5' exonuclease [Pedobacter sp.]